MSLREGLPDFQKLLGSGPTRVYPPFGPGPFAALPGGARVALRQGQPVLSLTLVRRPDQPGPTGNYAVLDLQLTDDMPLDDALALVRGISQGATVAPASIELGFIRLVPGGPGISLPCDMTAPVPLGWSAAGGGRWTQRLDVDTGELIKGALAGRHAAVQRAHGVHRPRRRAPGCCVSGVRPGGPASSAASPAERGSACRS